MELIKNKGKIVKLFLFFFNTLTFSISSGDYGNINIFQHPWWLTLSQWNCRNINLLTPFADHLGEKTFIFARCRINKVNIHSIRPRSTSLTPRNIQKRNLHVYKLSIVSTNKQEHLSTIRDVKWTFKRPQLTISNTKRKSLSSSDNRKWKKGHSINQLA